MEILLPNKDEKIQKSKNCGIILVYLSGMYGMYVYSIVYCILYEVYMLVRIGSESNRAVTTLNHAFNENQSSLHKKEKDKINNKTYLTFAIP